MLIMLFAYLLGSVPTGLVLSKFFLGKDIRSHGSGNIGTTNAYRVGGKQIAAFTLLGDAGKAVIALCIAKIAYHDQESMQALAAVFVMLGHMFSVFLKFSGGKGVATCTAALFVLYPGIAFIAAAVFLSTFYLSRYVSLASLIASIAALAASLVSGDLIAITMIFTMSLFIWIKHHKNIERLLAFSESRL